MPARSTRDGPVTRWRRMRRRGSRDGDGRQVDLGVGSWTASVLLLLSIRWAVVAGVRRPVVRVAGAVAHPRRRPPPRWSAGSAAAGATRWHRRGGGRPMRRRSRAGRGSAGSARSPDRLVMQTNRSPRANARTSGAEAARHRAVAEAGLRAADAQRRPVEAGASSRGRRLGLDGQGRPVRRLAEPGLAVAPRGLKPNGGSSPDHGSGTRQPSRPGSMPPGAEVHRVLDLVDGQVRRPRRGRARRPGRCTASPAGPPRAAPPRGPAGGRARDRVGRPVPLGRERERAVLAPVARDRPRHVVVGEDPGRRRADGRMGRERGIDRRAQARRRPRAGP